MSEQWELGRHPAQAEVHEPVEPEDRPERVRKLTKPRQRGLAELADRDPKPGFRSNQTLEGTGLVYWQIVDWLVDEGLAAFVPRTGRDQVVLTDAGRELAEQAS